MLRMNTYVFGMDTGVLGMGIRFCFGGIRVLQLGTYMIVFSMNTRTCACAKCVLKGCACFGCIRMCCKLFRFDSCAADGYTWVVFLMNTDMYLFV